MVTSSNFPKSPALRRKVLLFGLRVQASRGFGFHVRVLIVRIRFGVYFTIIRIRIRNPETYSTCESDFSAGNSRPRSIPNLPSSH